MENDRKISEFTEQNTLLNTDLFPFIREESGTFYNYKIAKANLLSNEDNVTIQQLNTTLENYALLDSPEFEGTPTAPNVNLGDSTTNIANTSFVQQTVEPLLTDFISIYVNNSLANKTYPIILNTPFGFKITRISYFLKEGIASVSLLKNGTMLIEATNLNVDDTVVNTTFTNPLTFISSDNLAFSISNATNALDFTLTIVIERII